MSKSATTTNLKNPTPGDVLLEEFLLPLAMSQTALAKAIGVPPRRTGACRRVSGSAFRPTMT